MNELEMLEKTLRKRLRVWLSYFVIVAGVLLILLIVCFPARYRPVVGQGGAQFVALYYSGVALDQSDGKCTPQAIRRQILALNEAGYVTIGNEQIEKFMAGEDVLPPKAVYLVFGNADGQAALFMNPIFEKQNYQAVFLGGVSQDKWDVQTLSTERREALLRSGFWAEGGGLTFQEGSGINQPGQPLTWVMPDNWSGTQLLHYIGEKVNHQEGGAYEWDCSGGQIFADGISVRLSSNQGELGRARLLASAQYGDWRGTIAFPEQEGVTRRIYFRADRTVENYLCLEYKDGTLLGIQAIGGQEEVLFSRQVSNQPFSMILNGSEWKLSQSEEIIAWVRTQSLQEGYVFIETEPGIDEIVAEGSFVLTLKRPDGFGEQQIYTTARPAQAAWYRFYNIWEASWDFIRVAL